MTPWGLAAVFAGLFVVYAIILRGSRDKAHRKHSDAIDALGVPTGGFAVVLLGSIALAQVLPLDNAVGLGSIGAVLGLLITVFLFAGKNVTGLVLDLAGTVAAVVLAVQFLVQPSSSNWSTLTRSCMMLGLFLCFGLGVVLRRRSRYFEHGRGLTLLGLVDIITFMAGPLGVDLGQLEVGQQVTYVAVAAATAVALGLAAAQITVILMGVGVAVVSVGLATLGGDASQFVCAAAAVAVYTILSKIFGPLLRR